MSMITLLNFFHRVVKKVRGLAISMIKGYRSMQIQSDILFDQTNLQSLAPFGVCLEFVESIYFNSSHFKLLNQKNYNYFLKTFYQVAFSKISALTGDILLLQNIMLGDDTQSLCCLSNIPQCWYLWTPLRARGFVIVQCFYVLPPLKN